MKYYPYYLHSLVMPYFLLLSLTYGYAQGVEVLFFRRNFENLERVAQGEGVSINWGRMPVYENGAEDNFSVRGWDSLFLK